jgi:hypothetical protein
MRRKRWTLEEKREIVLQSMESPQKAAEIRRRYRISDKVLKTWKDEVSKSPDFWQKLPKLPKIQDEFSTYEAYCLCALEHIVALAERLIARFKDATVEFLQNHDWFCMYSLDHRGITDISFFPSDGGYDIEKIPCKVLGPTLRGSVRKVYRHLSRYVEELRIKYPHLETKCVRLGQRTFLLYTSGKCKRVPRKKLGNLVRVRDEIDWIATFFWPDPTTPRKHKIKICFDTYICTDDGTVTTLEYLIRRFEETVNNLRTVEEADEQVEELVKRLEDFTNFYSRFV